MTTTSNTAGYVISSDKVEGTTVYNGTGEKLGSIDDLMIDKAPRYRQDDAPVCDSDYGRRIDRYYGMDA